MLCVVFSCPAPPPPRLFSCALLRLLPFPKGLKSVAQGPARLTEEEGAQLTRCAIDGVDLLLGGGGGGGGGKSSAGKSKKSGTTRTTRSQLRNRGLAPRGRHDGQGGSAAQIYAERLAAHTAVVSAADTVPATSTSSPLRKGGMVQRPLLEDKVGRSAHRSALMDVRKNTSGRAAFSHPPE